MTNYFKNSILNIYNKIFNINNNNFTKLHRWCTIVSPIYKNTCNWEKKMDLAAKDNCFRNYIK